MIDLLAVFLIAVWIVLVLFFRLNRIWLLYYITGAVGLALGLIFLGRSILPLETWSEHIVGLETHLVGDAVGIPTQVVEGAPGLLLVLIITQPVGWTAVQITIECSGLLESAVLLGMLAFYPAWSVGEKAFLIFLGLFLTHIANTIRLLFIIATLHYLGKDALFMAHTIVGRVVFFGAVVLIYWIVLTLPTLRTIRSRLAQEMTT